MTFFSIVQSIALVESYKLIPTIDIAVDIFNAKMLFRKYVKNGYGHLGSR